MFKRSISLFLLMNSVIGQENLIVEEDFSDISLLTVSNGSIHNDC